LAWSTWLEVGSSPLLLVAGTGVTIAIVARPSAGNIVGSWVERDHDGSPVALSETCHVLVKRI
jgi:hypothetical protein